MVFSSIPAYLDPANWQQQHNLQTGISNTAANPQLPTPPPPLQSSQLHVSAATGSSAIRPGSMAERARMANIPMPEGPLKCPRCESTNTKFCYFNNYSLSQPRHFCKTCRRYWTRGGALRNVPVGGGCRRNKRSKPTSSKSPVSSDRQTTSSSTSISVSSHGGGLGGGLTPQLPPLRFMSPLGQLSDHYNSGDIGLNFNSLSAPLIGSSEMNFQIGGSLLGGGGGGGGGVASVLSSGGAAAIEQWRLQQGQQFNFLSGLDPSTGLYQFQSGMEQQTGFVGEPSQVRAKLSNSVLTQLASVKMEDNNLRRQFLGIAGNDHQWNGNSGWTDLSSFSSSSTSNPL